MDSGNLKFAKVLCIAIVLLMLFGCSTAGTTVQTTQGAPSTQGSSPTQAAATTAAQKPEVTLTLYGINFPPSLQNGIQQDPVAQEIEKKTGVKMDITNISSQDDYAAKISAMAVSGDLPDMVSLFPTLTTTQDMLMKSNSVVDMGDLLKTNGQNLINNPKVKYYLDYCKAFMTNGADKYFWIPTNVGTDAAGAGLSSVGVTLRWDYYKELGYPAINNSDDLLNILEQMQKAHPKAANGKNAYGAGMWVDWGVEVPWEMANLDGYTMNQLLQTDISNEAVSPFFSDPNSNFWKWIKWIYDAKKRGILDPDSYTMKYDQFVEKIKNGELYFFTNAWDIDNYASKEADPTKRMDGYMTVEYAPSQDKQYSYFGSTAGNLLWCITKNCKNPDRAMDLWNFLASDEGMRLLYSGVEGNAYDTADGKPVRKQVVTDEVMKPNGGQSTELYGFKYGIMSIFRGVEIDPKDNYPYDITQTKDNYLTAHPQAYIKDYDTHYGVEVPSDVTKRKKYNSFENPIGTALPLPDGELKQVYDNVNEYINANWIKPILSKTDAEFEANKAKFIKEINDIGCQKVVDWELSKWNEIKAKVDTFGK